MNGRFKFRVWDRENKAMYYDIQDGVDMTCGWCAKDFQSFLSDQDYIIMQCVGLKDKKGKLVYEGDIIKRRKYLERGETYEYSDIFYENGAFFSRNGLCLYLLNDYEVVGNIHENKELLEGE